MKLILIRHGDALPDRNDFDRTLSNNGIVEVQKLSNFLKLNRDKFDLLNFKLLHSPLKRAEQTAQIIQEYLHFKQFEVHENLTPNADTEEWENHFYTLEKENLILVGHQPFMGDLILGLTSQSVGVLTGSATILEREDGRWKILAKFPDL